MIANPVDLFAEYALLNVPNCVVEPGGYFTVTAQSPGTFPLTLCVSADGVTFAPQTFTATGQAIVSVGTDNPYIDFSGGCPGGPGPFTGNYVVVAYNLPAADGCVAQAKAFTLWMVNNQVIVTRDDEACMYELWGKNPNDGSDDIPDFDMPTGYITAQALVDVQVQRRNLENCGGTGLVHDVSSYMGTSHADFIAAGIFNTGGLNGPYVTHSIQTGNLASTGINTNGYIDTFRVAGVGNITLSSVIKTGSMSAFRTAVRNLLITTLNGTIGAGNYILSVSGAGNYEIIISMVCANTSGWAGIDKTDGFLEWCNAGGCTIPADFDSTTTVTQSQTGIFRKALPDEFTTPCGEDLSCTIHTCPDTTTSPIYDLSNCNYDTLALDPATIGGRRYYVFDDFETSFRQAVCHTVSVEITGSGCANPPGPPVYSWQGGGANPKEFDPLQEDTAESDCGGCVAEKAFCYPEARRSGHDVNLAEGLACNTGSSTNLLQSIANNITDCDGNLGGGMTLASLTVHDVPAAFTSCTPNAATQRINSVHPSNILPRTYYYAYQFNEAGGEKSNYQLVRVNITPGNCCPA